MSTGQARRACLLNSACLRASGASPRHSAPWQAATRARSSKRAGGFIPRIALDQCRDPERYRTRAPRLRRIANRQEPMANGVLPRRVAIGHRPFAHRAQPLSESARCNSGGGLQSLANIRKERSRASAQAGFISPLCPGRHRRLRPFPPPCSSLRISFVKNSCRCNPGWRLHSICSRSPTQRHDVESVASAGATPAASTISACKH